MNTYTFEVWQDGRIVEEIEIEAESVAKAVCKLSDTKKGVFRLKLPIDKYI
jgi:hypothetical protein